MSYSEVMFKDKDNFHYKFPQNSCKRCLNYPCVNNMEKLKSDFAKFGCKKFDDANVFEWKK
jgi:hypothetical protein